MSVQFRRFTRRVTYHPHEFIAADEQRNSVAFTSRHFRVNEKILQFFRSLHAEGLKSVPGPPIANRQRKPLNCLPVESRRKFSIK